MTNKQQTTIDQTRYMRSEIDELFQLVKTDNGIIIVVGNHKVSTKTFKEFKDAEEYISKKPYELLINVTCLMLKFSQEHEKEIQKAS